MVVVPLIHFRACDPEATTVIYPSDHVVHLEVKFIEELRHAVGAAKRYEG
jgi:mannose-1-phosphate guanylyltransferase